MSKEPELLCALCHKPSAQFTDVTFDKGEVYEICPTCRQLYKAFEVLTTHARAVLQDIEKQYGEAGVVFFQRRLAKIGYEMNE